MGDINAAVLARMQRDADKFIETYQGRLDLQVQQHTKDLIPTWQRLYKRLTKQMDEIYGAATATNDLNRAATLIAKADRLKALANSVARDLATAGETVQPYLTGALVKQYEQSYYSHAWGLEQAAQVSVNVPQLNSMQVLGALANPWLPDGANYATRLGVNMAYFGQKMKDTVEQAITEGWGVNQAARALTGVLGESYNNSVRLVRTELNRAASLGSSYLYMQNSDILDGKRWNATLDSRTAPKDAANDGKQYDLDYDTQTSPGVPGQRIPNHPNCRCKYSPVISALGVSTKERIARTGDGPDSWGERTYTKARTYQEYAKARGLPDPTTRKDNLKAYLRPGETLADLKKNVVRAVFGGASIVVPRPLWETAKAEATAVDPLANIPAELRSTYNADGSFNYAAYEAEYLKRYGDNDDGFNYMMKHVDFMLKDLDELPAARTAFKLDGDVVEITSSDPDELYKTVTLSEKGKQLVKLFNEAKTYEEQYSIFNVKFYQWAREASTADEAYETSKLYYEAKHLLDIARAEQAKAWGGVFKLPTHSHSLEDLKLIQIDPGGSIRAAELKAAITEGNDWLGKHVHANYKTYTGISLERLPKGSRAYAYGSYGKVHLATDTRKSTAVHEAAHCMHDQSPRIRRMVTTFFKRRTAGERLEYIYSGKSEMGYRDRFITHYIGKVYSDDKPDNMGQEVVSMGLQYMYENPQRFYSQDPEHFKLIYAILRGLM